LLALESKRRAFESQSKEHSLHADNTALRDELRARTEWARGLEQHLNERTAWARGLEQQLNERTDWALGLDKHNAELTQRLIALQAPQTAPPLKPSLIARLKRLLTSVS
jgi:hypothetical protein